MSQKQTNRQTDRHLWMFFMTESLKQTANISWHVVFLSACVSVINVQIYGTFITKWLTVY